VSAIIADPTFSAHTQQWVWQALKKLCGCLASLLQRKNAAFCPTEAETYGGLAC